MYFHDQTDLVIINDIDDLNQNVNAILVAVNQNYRGTPERRCLSEGRYQTMKLPVRIVPISQKCVCSSRSLSTCSNGLDDLHVLSQVRIKGVI